MLFKSAMENNFFYYKVVERSLINSIYYIISESEKISLADMQEVIY